MRAQLTSNILVKLISDNSKLTPGKGLVFDKTLDIILRVSIFDLAWFHTRLFSHHSPVILIPQECLLIA